MLSSHWQPPTSSIVSLKDCIRANLAHVVGQPSPRGTERLNKPHQSKLIIVSFIFSVGNDTIITHKSGHSSETLIKPLHTLLLGHLKPGLIVRLQQVHSEGLVGRHLSSGASAGAAGSLQPLSQAGALVVGGVGGVEGVTILQLIPQSLIGRRLQ